MAKLPKLKFVKFTRVKGKIYAYFNTGKKVDGKLVFAPLPPFSSAGFFDSYGAMMGARTKRETRAGTIADLVQAYQKSPQFESKSPATRAIYASTMRRVVELFGEFPVDDLQLADITDALENDITSNGSRNIFVAVVGVLYAYARIKGLCDRNPAKGIGPFEMGTHEPWPAELLDAALQADDATIRLAVHLLYYTGQRIGDVLVMRWDDIRDGAVFVVPQKTKKKKPIALRIPLHSALEAELAQTRKGGLTILADDIGKPITQDRMRRALQTFAKDRGFHAVPHGLRKNAVNTLLEKGCTVAEVASITGQSFQMVEHYARRVDQHRLGDAAILKMETRGHNSTSIKRKSTV